MALLLTLGIFFLLAGGGPLMAGAEGACPIPGATRRGRERVRRVQSAAYPIQCLRCGGILWCRGGGSGCGGGGARVTSSIAGSTAARSQ